MKKKAKKGLKNTSRSKAITLIALLMTSILINISILTIIPSHFSFISLVIIILCSFLIFRGKSSLYIKSAQFSIYSMLTISIFYGILIYYWVVKGPYGCGGFFGEYSSCIESFQHSLLEILVTSVVILLGLFPLLLPHLRK